MSTAILPKLTPRDFSVLETMLSEGVDEPELLIPAIRKKLEFAQIVFADDLPDDVVTIGSRVVFTIDQGWPLERSLVPAQQFSSGQDQQTIASPRGIAMLGLPAGARTEVDGGGRVEWLEIHKVLYQPEAESRQRRKSSVVRLVSSQDRPKRASGRQSVTPPFDDDPGPSAA